MSLQRLLQWYVCCICGQFIIYFYVLITSTGGYFSHWKSRVTHCTVLGQLMQLWFCWLPLHKHSSIWYMKIALQGSKEQKMYKFVKMQSKVWCFYHLVSSSSLKVKGLSYLNYANETIIWRRVFLCFISLFFQKRCKQSCKASTLVRCHSKLEISLGLFWGWNDRIAGSFVKRAAVAAKCFLEIPYEVTTWSPSVQYTRYGNGSRPE